MEKQLPKCDACGKQAALFGSTNLCARCYGEFTEPADKVAVHKPVSKAPEAGGAKADTGKAPWHLLPFDAVEQVVKVLQFGAKKYAERNWEQGIAHSRTFAATHRHLKAWWSGEDKDPETGLSHLAHAACEVLFALAFECRGRADLDDRPRARAVFNPARCMKFVGPSGGGRRCVLQFDHSGPCSFE